ncbi:hypothetical protein [Cupriavidus sp. YAF13]|uniref:hypothetical protein n=1 Tax=Cupriavidus sp. YAF13 TaxID=3233075 RepID=UPI003F9385CB
MAAPRRLDAGQEGIESCADAMAGGGLAGIGFAALNLVAHGFMLRSRAVPMAAE